MSKLVNIFAPCGGSAKPPAPPLVLEDGLVVSCHATPRPDATGYAIRGTRSLENIDRITLHHTVSDDMPSIGQVNNWWRGRGTGGADWDRAGYHFLIRADGSVWQLTRLTAPSWGAGAVANPRSIHIAFAGRFSEQSIPTPAARDAYTTLARALLLCPALPALHDAKQHIVGHRHWAATSCPGFTCLDAFQLK